MLTDDRSTMRAGGVCPPAALVRAVATVVAVLLLAACSGDGPSAIDEVGDDRQGANRGPLPTIAGGVDLDEVDPVSLLVGADLAFGSPLPSEATAADQFTNEAEVRAVTVRRVFEVPTARQLGEVLVLSLDGAELFDEGVLRAFQDALVEALSGGEVGSLELVGRRTLHASGDLASVVAFREGSALVIVSSAVDADAVLVVTRQLEARVRGEVGTAELRTPLLPTPAEAAFLPVATIAFTPFSPPEDEPAPEAPALPAATGLQGRYGVVAGERRTTVWGISVDTSTYPTAEALEPAMRDLVAARAGGIAPEPVELIDRVVLVSTAPAGEASAQAFRHRGLVILVEGTDPAQLDAVTSAWIAALAAG